MNRLELRTKFRAENPEITTRVITDSELNEWMITANEEICCEVRCIVTNESEIIESVEDRQFYNLESEIDNFHDIDDMPGGGVYYDDLPLVKSSAVEMNYMDRNWKTRDSGTPKKYWRKGKYLWLDRAPDTSNVDIAVDCILRPDSFSSDTIEPFNGLEHLQSYSDSINKYLQWRVKRKVGKPEEGNLAYKDYMDYVAWMKSRVKSMKHAAVYMKPGYK